jgi:hypothetical protein
MMLPQTLKSDHELAKQRQEQTRQMVAGVTHVT